MITEKYENNIIKKYFNLETPVEINPVLKL